MCTIINTSISATIACTSREFHVHACVLHTCHIHSTYACVRVYACVCMHGHKSCMCVCVHMCIGTCARVQIHVCVPYKCVQACMGTSVCMHAWAQVCACRCAHIGIVCMRVCMMHVYRCIFYFTYVIQRQKILVSSFYWWTDSSVNE